MDDVLAAAFERVARAGPGARRRGLMAAATSPVEALRVFFRTYTPADKDWAFQLWLDAWAEAARRPAVRATSRRLNLEWQALLERTIRDGVGDGRLRVRRSGRRRVADPVAARWAGAPGRRPRDDDQSRRGRGLVDRRGRAGARAGGRSARASGLGADLLAHEQDVRHREAGGRHRHQRHQLRPDQQEALVERELARDLLLRLDRLADGGRRGGRSDRGLSRTSEISL